MTDDRPKAQRGLRLAQGPSEPWAHSVRECLLHSNEPRWYLLGLPGQDQFLSRGTCTHGGRGPGRVGPPQKELDFRLGARDGQSDPESAQFRPVHCWGAGWPFCLPKGPFLLLDPNPYWASTLCLSCSRHRVLQGTKGGRGPQRQKTWFPVLGEPALFVDIMAGYGPAPPPCS